MKRLSILTLSFLLCFLVSTTVFAAPIYIENHSFESNQPSDGGWVPDPVRGPWVYEIDGWNITSTGGDSGTFQPTSYVYPGGVPDGLNVAYSNGGIISQTLSDVLTAEMTYTLGVWIGNRIEPGFFPAYSIELWAGGLLASTGSVTPDEGEFLQAITYTSSYGGAYLGNQLEIRLVSTGGQLNYDLVTLDASPIPEPTTMFLLGSGLIGLAGANRRFKKG